MMLLMGKKFKTSEMLSGRFADIFSNIYLCYSMLWFYEKHCPKNNQTEKLMEYCMDELMYETQENFYDIIKNFPGFGEVDISEWCLFLMEGDIERRQMI